MMVLLVWLHMLASVSWIGGTIFLSVVLVPVLRREPVRVTEGVALSDHRPAVPCGGLGRDRRPLVHRPSVTTSAGDSDADPSGWPMVLAAKLGLVTILILLTLTHDLTSGLVSGRSYDSPRRAEPS